MSRGIEACFGCRRVKANLGVVRRVEANRGVFTLKANTGFLRFG